MNKTFTLLLLLGCFMYNVQAQDRITFNYDNAGNQIQRSLCLNCTSKTTDGKPKEIIALKEEDLQKFFLRCYYFLLPQSRKRRIVS
jgi:hypothetical protein